MDWNLYKTTLKANLVQWFQQISAIQYSEYTDEEVLFELNKNTLDAFSAMVDVYSSNSTFEEWIENEKVRQRQKSLQGKIGDMHEVMIYSLKPSIKKRETENCADGKSLRIYDLFDSESQDKWIAEVKNKHNTTKGDDRKASFDKLAKGLELVGDDYKAYYVTILRDTHEKVKKEFTPSDNTAGERKGNDRIWHVDGETFYEILTGEEDALSKAFDVLEEVLSEHYDLGDNTHNDVRDQIKSFSFFKTKVNINQANLSGLLYLPHIGETIAQNIIDYRVENGDFNNTNDLLKVDKLGKGKLAKILPFVEL
ncbi:Eco47II family restriction endonuclease [Pseudoalteromonas distincta]|uniref:Eco47II family restriction endonuclease n=1 Tax=Pseudoalteromonas distincta TaxID=77608 RepID=UPI00241F5E29|nr:Eco47II family restriction endonuclease [Pseudoalteromonas distincta]|tara:strand:+ start:94380 stop:95309 length:930 start_codon:yes stop_codon:yes gene_type:complete